jgi:hypothetical protein
MLAVAAVAYWVGDVRSPHGVTGGSVLGLWFGIVGSLFMVFAALLAVRKRLPTWRVGSAQFWLRAHLWLGSVGFLLILLHSGFSWGGPLEQWMWWAFGLVVLTGWIGVELQQIVPRLLTTRVPLETMVDQIPYLSQTMLFRADQLVAKVTGVLDVEYESLKPFAEEVLKQQRVLKRESDFPKELAKVYAGVELPADEKKPHAAANPSVKPAPAAAATNPAPDAAPSAKPKSPLELMREKAAAKESGGIAPTASASAGDAVTSTPHTEKKLSPLEQMKAKMAAKAVEPATSTVAPDAAEPATKKLSPLEQMKAKMAAKAVEPATSTVAPDAAEPATKKLSPLEQMKAKMAAKAVEPATSTVAPDAAEPAAKKLSPLEQMKAKMAAKAVEPATSTVAPDAAEPAAKKLSPLEQMKAKLAAANPAATEPSDSPHQPLTVEKPNDTVAVSEKPKPSIAKKPATAPATKPAAPTPLPAASLMELRQFHVRAVRPFLSSGRSPKHHLHNPIAARRLFSQLQSDLPPELHETLQQLNDLCEERRQFNTQLRLHRWLHGWLIFHIPPSIALLVLFVAHVLMALRVVPFGNEPLTPGP